MRPVLYLEPVGGIAGDMFLALAVDLGVSVEALGEALAGLAVPGWRLSTSRAERHAITGTHLDVVLDAPEGHAHRPLTEIRALIDRCESMPSRAKARARDVFEAIGEAEARIHGVSVEEIHFHEVGAVDSIVDICGAAVALELLGDPEVFSAPPPMGSGRVKSAHGNIPVPAPATLELLRNVPVSFEGVGELTTPTGAALLKSFATVGPPPRLTVEKVGYGVGTKDFPDRPNVLRGSLGRPVGQGRDAGAAALFVVEANLDDCSPQILGGLVEILLEVGALDAWVAPLTMKKGRPGHLLGALVGGGEREAVIDRILRESTTLGVRFHPVDRVELSRRFVEVETRFGRVRVKLGERGGTVFNVAPEYEDCRARAVERGVPVKEVWAEALARFRNG